MPSSSTRRRFAAAPIAAGLLVCALAAATPARAQFFIDEPEIRLSPRAVVTNLARRGYRDLTHPYFDGDTYTLEAADPRGIRVRLVVDAFDGAVLDRVRFEAPPVPPGFVGRPSRPGYGWTEEEPTAPAEARLRRVERPRQGVPVAANPPAASAPANPAGANPLGLNPDARPAPAKPETRAARAPEAVKPAAPKAGIAPAAPVPPIAPPAAARAPESSQEAPKEAARPEPTKAVEPQAAPKPESARPESAKPESAKPDVATVPEAGPKSDAKAAEPASPPPASEAPRQVRVIGGVTPPTTAPAKPVEPTGSGS